MHTHTFTRVYYFRRGRKRAKTLAAATPDMVVAQSKGPALKLKLSAAAASISEKPISEPYAPEPPVQITVKEPEPDVREPPVQINVDEPEPDVREPHVQMNVDDPEPDAQQQPEIARSTPTAAESSGGDAATKRTSIRDTQTGHRYQKLEKPSTTPVKDGAKEPESRSRERRKSSGQSSNPSTRSHERHRDRRRSRSPRSRRQHAVDERGCKRRRGSSGRRSRSRSRGKRRDTSRERRDDRRRKSGGDSRRASGDGHHRRSMEDHRREHGRPSVDDKRWSGYDERRKSTDERRKSTDERGKSTDERGKSTDERVKSIDHSRVNPGNQRQTQSRYAKPEIDRKGPADRDAGDHAMTDAMGVVPPKNQEPAEIAADKEVQLEPDKKKIKLSDYLSKMDTAGSSGRTSSSASNLPSRKSSISPSLNQPKPMETDSSAASSYKKKASGSEKQSSRKRPNNELVEKAVAFKRKGDSTTRSGNLLLASLNFTTSSLYYLKSFASLEKSMIFAERARNPDLSLDSKSVIVSGDGLVSGMVEEYQGYPSIKAFSNGFAWN